MNNLKWAFFGSSEFSVTVLETLKENGLLSSLIITVPDKPEGRKMILKPAEVKLWSEKQNIPCLQLSTLKSQESVEKIMNYFKNGVDFFLVTHYGKMIPDEILNIPKFKALNIHPSLLPKLRGPSPIKSAILLEKETGVTIIRLDSEMDHGPIIAQEKIESLEWPPYEETLKRDLAKLGANLLVKVLPNWILGKINEIEQEQKGVTFCSKIQKKDAEIDLKDSAEKNLRKIRAFHKWPGAYFFIDLKNGTKKRILVKRAHVENDELIIERVVPEGKREMDYKDFLKGIKTNL